MKNKLLFLVTFLLLSSYVIWGQTTTDQAKITISGKVVEKSTKSDLEYATITLKNTKNPKLVFGGVSNKKGDFSVEVTPGIYDIIIEFISLKSQTIKQKALFENSNLGTLSLEEDITQLNEVVVQSEKAAVEIKLDKRVYNVGKDLMSKGGTVSDILDNIPSVSVDSDGNVSLRGNENVKVLIDGKPSSSISIADALKLIPADAIDKVEVITNPSGRYDAEGGGGIINIVLKKGKNQGLNGSVTTTVGHPETYGVSGTMNYKTKKINLFTTQGYNYRNSPGNGFTNSTYLNEDNTPKNYMNESRTNERLSKSYNSSLGMDWFLNKSTTWTNAFNYRKSPGNNTTDVFQNYYDATATTSIHNRLSDENTGSKNYEYTTNLTKNFKKEGHKLTMDGSISKNTDLDEAIITDTSIDNTSATTVVATDKTINNQTQKRGLFQTDYVLPLKKGGQFEAGYKGDFSVNTTDYSVTQNGIPNNNLSNILEYKRKINALYSQYGFKANKFSTLLGLRWEDSHINVNQLATQDFNTNKYNNFFPSAFFSYEMANGSSTTISYSRRIQRPNQRQLNPFNNLTSNVNIFVGNPFLNPSFTDAVDWGYIKRWQKLTFNSSVYANRTSDVIQFVRKETGIFNNGVPVVLTTPINLAKEYRGGLELTLNYSPIKWWKLNGNFNFFYIETDGDYTYTNNAGEKVYQNFDFKTSSWFTKVSSKVTLPYKIDWQTNMTYNAEQKNAQGKSLGIYFMTFALSKDILKDKGTLNFNVSDVFNSRKRKIESYVPGVVSSYSEMLMRVRQINLSFTYRFNMQKNDKDKKAKNGQPGGDDNDIPN